MSATCTTMSYSRSGFVCRIDAICARLSIWNVPIVSPRADQVVRLRVVRRQLVHLRPRRRCAPRSSSNARRTSDSAPSPRKSNFGTPTASRSSLSNWMIVRPIVVCSMGSSRRAAADDSTNPPTCVDAKPRQSLERRHRREQSPCPRGSSRSSPNFGAERLAHVLRAFGRLVVVQALGECRSPARPDSRTRASNPAPRSARGTSARCR